MKDIRVNVTIKNNVLVTQREQRGWTQTYVAKLAGITLSLYGSIENLKIYPVLQNGEWNNTALSISSAFGLEPEVLFPHALSLIQKRRASFEINVDEMKYLSVKATQELLISNKDKSKKIEAALSTLTPKEQFVLNKRFGLNGEEELTMEEVGKLMPEFRRAKKNETADYYDRQAHGLVPFKVDYKKITPLQRERIRQIEARALRKLRHPTKAKTLKDFDCEE